MLNFGKEKKFKIMQFTDGHYKQGIKEAQELQGTYDNVPAPTEE